MIVALGKNENGLRLLGHHNILSALKSGNQAEVVKSIRDKISANSHVLLN